ncbi:MAG: dienelactone hydrolase family protein [Planctomycetota bacterium]|nr:dienelactone hydrolase family protein [Planctomycetota bacterium]
MKPSVSITLLFTWLTCGLPIQGQEPAPGPLAGTRLLEKQGDLAADLVAGVDRFLLREIDKSVERRARHWKRSFISSSRYRDSVEPNRGRLRKAVGAVDPREPFEGLELVGTTSRSALVGEGKGFEFFAVRWPVVRGVQGEGLLLLPSFTRPVADIVAIPDADQTPEMLVGLEPGVPPASQFARRLAESGCRVVVPLLIDRGSALSTTADGSRKTRLSHREFLYRPAFELGRHIIGYEVQKILALVDWFAREAGETNPRVGVAGYGEGGLLAFYSAALDERIDAALVSGYFEARESVWREPIYRNVFALLHEFGDAEIASLIAPRGLVVEACRGPEVVVRTGTGGGPGRLRTPPLEGVQKEFERARALVSGFRKPPPFRLIESGEGRGPCGSEEALAALLEILRPGRRIAAAAPLPEHLGRDFEPRERLRRQFRQIERDTQFLLGESAYLRREFWKKADRKSRSAERWKETTRWYREYFSNEVIGRFDLPLLPANARSRTIYDEPGFRGYEVLLDVFPDVVAYGILLVPKGIPAGERRPVVVCQHGLEGRPTDVAKPGHDHPAYHSYAVRLAERGFVTYAPQNLYIFGDRFRTLQRKANPLKKTLFSIIVPQHQQATDWLASLPFVDPQRIAFYGLSYGGKTAMRVPPLVDNYCLSICSADFNEWIWKNASTRSRYSYVATGEYEIFEFDLGMTFNYAEMAGLIAPRPFMVERGHRDGVAPDEAVAYEFAKVRLLYADLKIAERAEIEFFEGPHTIHGVKTFEFLHRHLKWPAPASVGERP